MPALIAAGYRAVAIDLPGHGLSERPSEPGSYTLSRVTAHVLAALDALQLERPHIVAQSMGGRIALEIARLHPQRVTSLVLFGSVGLGAVPSMVSFAPYVPAPTSQMVKRWMIELGEMFTYGRRARVDASFIDAYWAPTQFPDFLSAMRQALIEFDWEPLPPLALSQILAPTLVIFGTRDRTVKPVNTDEQVRALPHGQMHWVQDAGHVANEEAYDEVNPLVLEFIRRNA